MLRWMMPGTPRRLRDVRIPDSFSVHKGRNRRSHRDRDKGSHRLPTHHCPSRHHTVERLEGTNPGLPGVNPMMSFISPAVCRMVRWDHKQALRNVNARAMALAFKNREVDALVADEMRPARAPSAGHEPLLTCAPFLRCGRLAISPAFVQTPHRGLSGESFQGNFDIR